jgi:MFS family permease
MRRQHDPRIDTKLRCLLGSRDPLFFWPRTSAPVVRAFRGKQEILSTLEGKSRRLTPIDWIICGVACIGFAFDTYELLVLTLTVQPALTEFLAAKPGSAEFNRWIGLMFYVPAIAGGIFGLLGGYLIDRFGRRRVLFWSFLLFCFSALATGYSSSALQLLIYRCITFVGVSV